MESKGKVMDERPLAIAGSPFSGELLVVNDITALKPVTMYSSPSDDVLKETPCQS